MKKNSAAVPGMALTAWVGTFLTVGKYTNFILLAMH